MKYLIFFLSFPLFAQDNCQKLLDDVRLHCESAISKCDDLNQCLGRREACVPQKPSNESECLAIHSCMQEHKNDFDENTKCEYKWAISASGSGFCHVKSHFLFSREACPGRVYAFLNAAAYGLSAAVDGDFNCKAVRIKQQKINETCQEKLSAAKTACANVPDKHAEFKVFKCREAPVAVAPRKAIHDASRREDLPSQGGSAPSPANSAGR